MTPDQATFLRDSQLRLLEREQATTKAVLEAAPADRGEYRPEPNAKSAFELAWHIASAENMFLEAVITGQFVFGTPRPESIRNTADVAKWFGEQMEKQRKRLAELSPEDLLRIVDFRGMVQQPAVVFLGLSTLHSVHHRGQLSTYVRPMGGKVPAIYGESYDSAQARKAAQ